MQIAMKQIKGREAFYWKITELEAKALIRD